MAGGSTEPSQTKLCHKPRSPAPHPCSLLQEAPVHCGQAGLGGQKSSALWLQLCSMRRTPLAAEGGAGNQQGSGQHLPSGEQPQVAAVCTRT